MKIARSITFFLFAAALMPGCKKQSQTASVLSYTSRMAGMHVWSGTAYDYTSVTASSPDTTISFTADSMYIVVINDSTININFDTLRYFASSYKDTIAFAVRYYDSVFSISLADTLWYNYSKNTIAYHYRFASQYNPPAQVYEYIDEHTP